MKTYLKKLIVCLEVISYPSAGRWSRNKVEANEVNDRKLQATFISSPDSVYVRGRSDKKNNNYRVTLAP